MDLLQQLTSNMSSNCGPFVLMPLSMLKRCLKPDVLSSMVSGNKCGSPNLSSRTEQKSDEDNDSMFSEQTIDSFEKEMDTDRWVEESTRKLNQRSIIGYQGKNINRASNQRTENTSNRRRIGRKTRNKKQSVRSDSSSLDQGIDYENLYKANEDDSNLSAFCKVCGDKASIHVHYGGRSCASCRAFFRRSVEAKAR